MNVDELHKRMQQDQIAKDRENYIGHIFRLSNLNQYHINRQIYRGISIWYNDAVIFGTTKFPLLEVEVEDLFAHPMTQIAVFKCKKIRIDSLLIVKRFKAKPDDRSNQHFDIQSNFRSADWKYIDKVLGEKFSIPKHDFTRCFTEIK